MSDYIIEMLGITKIFPGVIANDNINLQIKKGEIHALLGENGAGKSTLMSILSGLYNADKGIIKKDGKEINIKSPNDATKHGIGIVHQNFNLIDVFTVLDNIILGSEPTQYGFLSRKKARKKVIELSRKYSIEVEPEARIENLSVAMRQKVEILKMLYRNNDILIFDEPTAVLTPYQADELIKAMKDFAKQGKAILFITHKLDEIMKAADTVTVLRKGKNVTTVKTDLTDKKQLSEMMVGKPIDFKPYKKPCAAGETVLKVENLTVSSEHTSKNKVNRVSFKARRGEIVCIAGVDGNGQSELISAITSLKKSISGKIEFLSEDITHMSAKKRNSIGISHIPEDRQKQGLVSDFSLKDNLILKKYKYSPFSHSGIIKNKAIIYYADTLIKNYDIRSAEGVMSVIRNMSGGNQQKAVIAREIDSNSSLIIAVQPTRGLDVGAAEAVYKILIKSRDEGKAIILVSFELDEVLSLADRILVMYEGEITAELSNDNITPTMLGLYISGALKENGGVK